VAYEASKARSNKAGGKGGAATYQQRKGRVAHIAAAEGRIAIASDTGVVYIWPDPAGKAQIENRPEAMKEVPCSAAVQFVTVALTPF
jgi:hypothetical protein